MQTCSELAFHNRLYSLKIFNFAFFTGFLKMDLQSIVCSENPMGFSKLSWSKLNLAELWWLVLELHILPGGLSEWDFYIIKTF